jgi:cell division protein FtsB
MLKKSFSLLFLLSFSLVLLIFILISLARVSFQAYQIEQEIVSLEKEIRALEQKKKNLNQLIEYAQTEFFKEEEARLKLGLQKPGEKVVVISTPETSLVDQKEKDKKTENPIKWWRYFFESKASR